MTVNKKHVELETSLSDRWVELVSPDLVRSYVADQRNLLKHSELAERRAFIRNFVKEVRVTGDEVILACKFVIKSLYFALASVRIFSMTSVKE